MKKTWEITLPDGRVITQTGQSMKIDGGALIILDQSGVTFALGPAAWSSCKPAASTGAAGNRGQRP